MTSEEAAFWRHLEHDPTDFTCRLVFSDWLEEQGDARAEGMRALAVGRHEPKYFSAFYYGVSSNPYLSYWTSIGDKILLCLLPIDWWTLIDSLSCSLVEEWWLYWGTRREAESAAALAFAKLPAERRAELLSGSVVPAGAG